MSTAGLAQASFSWNIANDVNQLLSYHFMVNALRAGFIVAVMSGAVGWFMVLRRQSFAGHTLAIVTFPGAAGAVLIGASATGGYFVAALVAAIVISLVPRAPSGHLFSAESAVVGTVQAFALACGALFVTLYGGFLNGITNLLFGTLLGVSDSQVLILLLVGIATILILGCIGRPLWFATIDPDVARARRVPVRLLSTVFLLLLGLAAAEASQITGALLVFALLVMPAASAQRLTLNPAWSLTLTAVIGIAAAWLGLGIAYFSPYPAGFWITTIAFAIYVLAVAGKALAGRWAGRSSRRESDRGDDPGERGLGLELGR